MITPGELNTYDVLVSDYVVFTSGTLPVATAAADSTTTEVRTVVKDPRDVIIRPVVSEKSYGLLDTGVYTFIVAPTATKPEIRDAVQAIWPGVKVSKVNTLNRSGKKKRNRRSPTMGSRSDTKRALVTLAEGSDQIDLFEVK